MPFLDICFALGMSLTTLEYHQAKVASRRAGAAADAPAKINLTLEVLGRRPDGYHDLRSLVIGVDLSDRVSCRITPQSGVVLHCNDPALCNDDNLAVQAARTLAHRCAREPSVSIDLRKRIPVGAGLGGGSSDAATTLRLCNELWQTDLNDRELAALGAEIGSDVPLFFSLPAAFMEGRGELVSPVTPRWSGWVLLVYPGLSISTGEVYRAWRREDSERFSSTALSALVEASTAAELSSLLSNHLEPAVFRVCPALYTLRDELVSLGLTSIRVTGSGSAMYSLFDDQEPAVRAADEIAQRLTHVTTTVAAAPVGQSPVFYEES